MRTLLKTYLAACLMIFPLIASAEDGGKKFSRSEYIDMWKDEAIYQMVVHKIPASITLAQGILESADGNSDLAKKHNNHFGIKCHSDWKGKKTYHDDDRKGECFRSYRDAKESFDDHSDFLKRKRYKSLFNYKISDYKAWAKGLKKCGYATSSKYANLLIKIIEENDLKKYDKQGMKMIDDGSDYVVEAPKKEKSKKAKKNKKEGTEIVSEINLSPSRAIQISDNKIKFIEVKEGDNFRSLAEEFEMMPWQFKRYNDLTTDKNIEEGQILYLQPKRGKSKTTGSHEVRDGDSIWSISQQYGVKIKKLYKLNSMVPGVEVQAGQTIKLR